ncbi:ribosomal RNA adenine dimethylase-domain-containing protein [Absidia repens]|uniref:rRNA adenine N(6)-methyltransferase n=1 Tax=Absidia repens TaxID=90262 RepID=A0A1X2IR11_9FUNG|nr:ribosomal RNA adenine dimethylase-domain-containing protein [Absidia repens]
MSSVRSSLVPKIPTFETWSKQFRGKTPRNLPRCTIADVETAEIGFKRLRQHTKWTNVQLAELTAVEIYPGLGVWTSALFNGGFNSIYSLEPNVPYYKQIKSLADKSEGVIRPLKKDGYDWETYVELKDKAYLGSLMTRAWNKVNQNIFFTGTLPKSSKGEQLLAQFATCIVNKMALHSMGRIPMALWIPDQLYEKFTASRGSKARCKMSVVTEACAEIDLIYSTQSNAMYPKELYHLVYILPRPIVKIKADWDVFEYVLKHLFVMQRFSLNKVVRTLGPGADIILDRLSFDTNIQICDMTAEQIDQVAIKFDQWPLRPQVLIEDSNPRSLE